MASEPGGIGAYSATDPSIMVSPARLIPTSNATELLNIEPYHGGGARTEIFNGVDYAWGSRGSHPTDPAGPRLGSRDGVVMIRLT
jgi:hypothetical protein